MSYLKIFISYNHRDEIVKDELIIKLTTLKEKGLISVWEDRKIIPGQKWDNEIEQQLQEAEVALLLVSPDFLNSRYINDVELPKVIQKEKAGEMIVIPILIRECDFIKRSDIAKFQALPNDAKPLSLWDNKREAWQNIIYNLERMILLRQGDERFPAFTVVKETKKTKVVILYDLNDRTEYHQLKKHFFVLTLTKDIQLFDIHEDITTGNRDELIKQACSKAQYILCYITPDFWQSCYNLVRPFLTSGKTNQIIPLKIKNTSAYQNTPLSLLKSYPSDGRYVSDWKDPNDGFSDIVDNIGRFI